ncbi:MAG TPA: aspartate aminotransferase family protein [Candidatus Limnocylindrales bacterium]|nr:aspartate aminotransferase family protein [Candidatus Limnocylindrales bacterium]
MTAVDATTTSTQSAAADAWPVPTTESERLFARASAVSPGGVQGEGRSATPYPLFMTRARGSRIWDVDGNEYIDFHSSFGAVLLGHNDPRIRAAAIRAMDEHGVSFSAANPLEVELAERLVEMIPSAEKVVFSCTGTEATYHAIRLARGYTGRERIVKFEGNYHGWHDYVAWSHHFATDEGGGVPTPVAASVGIPAAVRDLVEVREYNDAAGVRDLLAREGDTIAAVIVEPVFHNAGAVLPEPGFLDTLREACTAAGTLLIFDEVITGFRHGVGGAQARYGVTPDLTTMGKALGNGFPISVLAGRAEIMDHLGPKGDVLFAGTFAGQAMNCAIALEVTEIVREGAIHSHLARLGDRLTSGIQAAIDATGARAQVRSIAGVWTIYFTDEPIRRFRDFARFAMDKNHPIQRGYRNWLLERGIYVHPHYMIRGFLTGAHTEADVDRVVEATASFLEAHRTLLAEPVSAR